MYEKERIARELLKMARQVISGKIENLPGKIQIEELRKLTSTRSGMWRVTQEIAGTKGVLLGFLSKIEDTDTETYPWQAFAPKFVATRPAQFGKLLGSFLPKEGGRDRAIKELIKYNKKNQ
jgi:hypothetical protein